jgi:predicted kinase
MPTIILVAGYSASGKTRVGRELACRLGNCCYLDKDTLFEPLVDRLIVALGQSPGDRDSDVYRGQVRSLEYQCLMEAGFEAASFGVPVLLSAPFLHQLADDAWMRWLKLEAESRGFQLRVVWVNCPREVLQQRMIDRGSPRDHAKLAGWPTYSASVDENFPRRIGSECLVFDNCDMSQFESQMQRILAYIQVA